MFDWQEQYHLERTLLISYNFEVVVPLSLKELGQLPRGPEANLVVGRSESDGAGARLHYNKDGEGLGRFPNGVHLQL